MTTETFTLTRPLKTHNGEVLTLTLQEPTAGAFIDYGEPFTLKPRKGEDGEPEGVTFVYDNNKAFMRFLVDMIAEKGIDDLVLKSISASDFQRLRGVATNIILLGVQDERPT
ncbi:hypothetical protein [Bradyrhizobium sp. CCBAU 11357]|uniref:hypothetical protein n=1 Tax=Bradyrhizobium sp. CCBAU 11357 TaxID=1630808 RepID=UPI00230285CD|nr:hypothetical protein [Bradyrhizobium sp. CCBAU 11357]MDA9498430.1 hypothetical protein [Bradyrhizobium sp. CCBAU 11357]